jgi:hypothetical protein
MLQQIKGMKTLTRFIARDQRASVVALEESLRDLASLVDRFYELLGPRHWMFHERLSTDAIASLLDYPAEQAERQLIAIYRDEASLSTLMTPLNRFEELRRRTHLIERARTDYFQGRFYACTLVLLTVMDGFVNDIDARRRGLHARDADDMNAWDSVVGHHLGLAHAHRSFTKSTSKTSDEPLYDLQRNGIIHGTLTNYDNVVVATKAWNRLFAVADWATSVERQAVDPEPEPTWGELFRGIARNDRVKRALDEWQPRIAVPDEIRATNVRKSA